jgi:hypothetical protein
MVEMPLTISRAGSAPTNLSPKDNHEKRILPLTQADIDGAIKLRTNPSTGHILVTKNDPVDLQDWALNG